RADRSPLTFHASLLPGGPVTTSTSARHACIVAALVLGSAGTLRAQIEIGAWVKKVEPGGPGMTMEITRGCGGGGRRLTYHLLMGNVQHVMLIESPLDGTEKPVMLDGKPTGETMAIKRLDPHHAVTVMKMNGKPFGSSKATLSPNGRTLTVDNEVVG